MKRVFFGLLAILASPLCAEVFDLGEDFVPSVIRYRDLARNIERRFEDLQEVKVTSLYLPPLERFFEFLDRTPDIIKARLYFHARVAGEELLQKFRCRMDVVVGRSRDSIFISKCQNSQRFTIHDFSIDDMIQFNGRIL